MLAYFRGMAIRNIIFDLGGVILDIDISETQRSFRKLGIEQIESLFGLGHAASFFRDHEQGRITDDQFVEEVKKLVKTPIKDEDVLNAWNAMLLKFPQSRIEFLKKLREKYRLFLFSNTNGIHLRAFREIFTKGFPGAQLDDLFEKAYYSHLMGKRKPDTESFLQIVRENELNPSETLFIDDAESNVKGAREAGLQAVLLEPGKTIMDLGLLNSENKA